MPRPTSLMTQYQNGQLASRELQNMLVDYAAEARFDRDMHDDIDLYSDRKAAAAMFGRDGKVPAVYRRV